MSDLHKTGPIFRPDLWEGADNAPPPITRLEYAELLILRYGNWREDMMRGQPMWAGDIAKNIFSLAKEEYDEEARRQRKIEDEPTER